MKIIIYIIGGLLCFYVGFWVCFIGGWVQLLGLAVTVFKGGAFSAYVCTWGLIKAFGGGFATIIIGSITMIIGELFG